MSSQPRLFLIFKEGKASFNFFIKSCFVSMIESGLFTQDSNIIETFEILLVNLLRMFLKKVLDSVAILLSSKISTSLTLIFLEGFDDLSFVFPISSFIIIHVF